MPATNQKPASPPLAGFIPTLIDGNPGTIHGKESMLSDKKGIYHPLFALQQCLYLLIGLVELVLA